MDDTWQPWSAASLACGALLLVLAGLALPVTPDLDGLIDVVATSDAQWMMASVALFLASIGLTLGLPAMMPLLTLRHEWIGKAGLTVWAIGAINFTGMAAMLLLFRVLVTEGGITQHQLRALTQSVAVPAYLGSVLGCFLLGELVLAVCLWRTRHVRRWVPALMLAHLVLVPVNQLTSVPLQSVQELVLGIALMGVAVQTNEHWVHTRRGRA